MSMASSLRDGKRLETAHQAYFSRLGAVCRAQDAPDSILIAGLADNDLEGGGRLEYSAKQLKTLRHVVVTKGRAEHMNHAVAALAGGEDEDSDGQQCFTAEDGKNTIRAVDVMLTNAARKRTLSGQFDALFSLSWVLREHPHWLHNEYDQACDKQCEAAMQHLAAAWKKVLQRSDAELGIDAEFTRPGVLAMLETFAQTLADVKRSGGALRGFAFPWR